MMFMRTILALSLAAFALAVPVAQPQGGLAADLDELLDNHRGGAADPLQDLGVQLGDLPQDLGDNLHDPQQDLGRMLSHLLQDLGHKLKRLPKDLYDLLRGIPRPLQGEEDD